MPLGCPVARRPPTQPTRTAFALQCPYSYSCCRAHRLLSARRVCRACHARPRRNVVVGYGQPRRRSPSRSPGVFEEGSPLQTKTVNFSTYTRSPPLHQYQVLPSTSPSPSRPLQRPRRRCLLSPAVRGQLSLCRPFALHITAPSLHACSHLHLSGPLLGRLLRAAAAAAAAASGLHSLRRCCILSRRFARVIFCVPRGFSSSPTGTPCLLQPPPPSPLCHFADAMLCSDCAACRCPPCSLLIAQASS